MRPANVLLGISLITRNIVEGYEEPCEYHYILPLKKNANQFFMSHQANAEKEDEKEEYWIAVVDIAIADKKTTTRSVFFLMNAYAKAIMAHHEYIVTLDRTSTIKEEIVAIVTRPRLLPIHPHLRLKLVQSFLMSNSLSQPAWLP